MSAETILNLINEVLENDKLHLLTELDAGEGKGFDAEEFYKTALSMFKPPSELAGKLDTEERSFFKRYLADNITGKTLPEKVKQLNALMSSSEGIDADNTPLNYILSSLGALKILQETIDDFSESAAGFTFEAFLAGLLAGVQVTGKEGGQLPIDDVRFWVNPKTGEGGQPVSLKLLTGQGDSTLVKGSIKNLLGFFKKPEIAAIANTKGIEYIVALKYSDKGLGIYSFNIRPNNFFEWIEESAFDFKRLEAAPEEEPELQTEGQEEGLEDATAKFKQAVGEFLPMFGMAKEFEPNMMNLKTGKVDKWKKQIIPYPIFKDLGAAAVRDLYKSTADGALSPEGDAAYTKFMGQKGAERYKVYKGKPTGISDELKGQWGEVKDEHPSVWMPVAKKIRGIVDHRFTAFKDAMEKVSTLEDWSFNALLPYAKQYRKKTFKDAASVELLHNMSESNDAKAIERWAETMQKLHITTGTHAQFHIPIREVKVGGNDYGTITFDKKKIFAIINAYADVLKKQVAPVYKSFANLNESINAYFLENQPGSAGKASEWAVKLQKDVGALPKITAGAPASPRGMSQPGGQTSKGTSGGTKSESQEFDNQLERLLAEVFKK
jgi:hypothetical protein